MGGLRKDIPFTFWMMIIGTLALTGFPFTAGYYSKDAIIEAAYAARPACRRRSMASCMTVLAAGLTSFYSLAPRLHDLLRRAALAAGRGMAMTPCDRTAHAAMAHHAHDTTAMATHEPQELPSSSCSIPLAVLAVGALARGPRLQGRVRRPRLAALLEERAVLRRGRTTSCTTWKQIPRLVSLLPTLMMLGGFLAVGLYVSRRTRDCRRRSPQRFPVLYKFLLNKWYFDELYDFIFVRPAFWLGRLLWKGGDGAIIDGFGPDGVAARVHRRHAAGRATANRLYLSIMPSPC